MIEAACCHTAESLRFCPLYIPHTATVMVMALAFHTKDPDRVEDTLNIFLFPDLSPSARSEAALLTRKWDVILGGETLTYFTDMRLLMGKKKVASILGWDEAESQLETRRKATVKTPSPKISLGKDMGTGPSKR